MKEEEEETVEITIETIAPNQIILILHRVSFFLKTKTA